MFLKILKNTLLIVIVFSLMGISAFTADKGVFSTSPKTNNGKKWRIGYFEGGEYIEYQQTFIATIKGLMELGWIEEAEIPEQKSDQTKELWNWLATQAKSKYIQFLGNAHYIVPIGMRNSE